MSRKRRKQHQQQRPSGGDCAWFDGSANPNPGGPLGLGWHWILADGTTYAGQDHRPAAPDNTNNRAEYHALIRLLADYARHEQSGPLLIHGDSELVINQASGAYAIHDPALEALCDQVDHLAESIPGGVTYVWIPRSQNVLADRLASGISEAEARQPRVQIYAQTPPSGISRNLAQAIVRLNRQDSLGFREGMALKSGGRDHYSQLMLSRLIEAVGEACVQEVESAFPASDDGTLTDTSARLRERAMRWCLRGLEVHHAIRKVQIDAEVSANAERRSQR